MPEPRRGIGDVHREIAQACGIHPGTTRTRRISAARSTCACRTCFTALAQFAESGRQFDLILADPPYGEKNVGRRSTSFAQQLLDDVNLPKLLAPAGRFVLGHTKRDTLDIVAPWRGSETAQARRQPDAIFRARLNSLLCSRGRPPRQRVLLHHLRNVTGCSKFPACH